MMKDKQCITFLLYTERLWLLTLSGPTCEKTFSSKSYYAFKLSRRVYIIISERNGDFQN